MFVRSFSASRGGGITKTKKNHKKQTVVVPSLAAVTSGHDDDDHGAGRPTTAKTAFVQHHTIATACTSGIFRQRKEKRRLPAPPLICPPSMWPGTPCCCRPWRRGGGGGGCIIIIIRRRRAGFALGEEGSGASYGERARDLVQQLKGLPPMAMAQLSNNNTGDSAVCEVRVPGERAEKETRRRFVLSFVRVLCARTVPGLLRARARVFNIRTKKRALASMCTACVGVRAWLAWWPASSRTHWQRRLSLSYIYRAACWFIGYVQG